MLGESSVRMNGNDGGSTHGQCKEKVYKKRLLSGLMRLLNRLRRRLLSRVIRVVSDVMCVCMLLYGR